MSHRTLNHDFGTFTGFNHREDKPIDRTLTDEDIVWWDHDRFGEATFWPKGGHAGLAILCSERKWITGMELRTLDRLLTDLGDDSKETYQRIHFARSELGISLNKLTVQEVEEVNLQVFTGSTFSEQRKEAAWEQLGNFLGRVKYREKKGPVTQAVDWERVLNGPLRADLEAALRKVEAIPDEED